MNRRQLALLILVNALVSLAIALAVVWAFERRRPAPEDLAARITPSDLVSIATPNPVAQVSPALPTATTGAQEVSTPEPQPAQTEPEIYVVQSGDSLLGIALRYNLTMEELIEYNDLDNPDFVFVGQRLRIPPGSSASGEGQTAAPASPAVQIRGVENSGNLDGENVFLVNEGNVAANLQGWALVREGGPAYTFGDVPLFPGGSVRLHSTGGADTSLDLYWGQPSPVWSAGSVVQLLNPAGNVVDSYTVP